MKNESLLLTRRNLGLVATSSALGVLAACHRRQESQPAPVPRSPVAPISAGPGVPAPLPALDPGLPPPPTIGDGQCGVTEPNILGPYYLPGAPERTSLWPDAAKEARRILVHGRVVDENCRPITDALIEEWQADHLGVYDLRGPRFRCVQRPTPEGVYEVASVLPGNYLNGDQYRPAHLHFRIVAPGFKPLVTQLYFRGDRYNAIDPYIRKSLIMTSSGRSPDGAEQFHYRFVLSRA